MLNYKNNVITHFILKSTALYVYCNQKMFTEELLWPLNNIALQKNINMTWHTEQLYKNNTHHIHKDRTSIFAYNIIIDDFQKISKDNLYI